MKMKYRFDFKNHIWFIIQLLAAEAFEDTAVELPHSVNLIIC